MTAARKMPPPSIADLLADDLKAMGVLQAESIAHTTVHMHRTDGSFAATAHLIIHCPKKIDPPCLIRLMEKHGLKPRLERRSVTVWTEHNECASGWCSCWHHKDAPFCVVPFGFRHYEVFPRPLPVTDGPSEELFIGTREQCMAFVEGKVGQQ